jgi:hypothetical protein
MSQLDGAQICWDVNKKHAVLNTEGFLDIKIKLCIFRFPDKAKKRKTYDIWVRNCRRTELPAETALVCSEHFEPAMVNRTMKRARLRDGAIPTVFDLPSHLQVCMFIFVGRHMGSL